jgi:hypothetical protein
VYLDNSKSDPFRTAVLGLIRAAKASSPEDPKLSERIAIVSSYLKAYHFKREAVKPKVGAEPKKSSATKIVARRAEDNHLRIDFGGLLANLEDREWRVLAKNIDPEKESFMGFSPGDLAMIVFPDHQTLSLAMRSSEVMNVILRDRYGPPVIDSRKRDADSSEKPCVCLISREMIQSI